MNHFVLTFFAIILGAMFIEEIFFSQPEAELGSEVITLPKPVVMPRDEHIAYMNITNEFTSDNRHFTFKGAFEYSNMNQCQQALNVQNNRPKPTYYMCSVHDLCPSKETRSCSYYVEPIYKRMLNQQFIGTHFLHIKNTTAAETGVLAFWGMTDGEAKRYCEFLIQQETANGLINQCF